MLEMVGALECWGNFADYMTGTVSVDEALKRGHRMLTYPSLIILIGGNILFPLLGFLDFIPGGMVILGTVLSIILPFLYWSFMVTKWRLWAFSNVRNVHELQQRAILERLIGKDGSFYERTEIRTRSQKEQWEVLKSKFLIADSFEEDYSIPPSTEIYYSKKKMYVQIIVLVVFGLLLCIPKTDKELYLAKFIPFIIISFLVYRFYRQLTNKVPRIIINDDGLETASTPFYTWREISYEKVQRELGSRNTQYYLIYHHPGGISKSKINDYGITSKQLSKLLIFYRNRYNNQLN